MSIRQEIRQSFREGSIIVRLIYINAAVFLFVRLADFVCHLSTGSSSSLTNYVAMPIDFEQMILKPWTLLTYMFFHYDVIHIIFNMLCLHWFGRIFAGLIGTRLILRTYLFGGVGGAVLCMLSHSLLSSGSILLGSSAAVLALLAAVAVWSPNHVINIVFVGNVRLKFYALFFLLIDLVSIASWDNAGGHIAHLGGAFIGAILAIRWRTHGLPEVSQWSVRRPLVRRTKLKVVHNRPLTDAEYNAQNLERTKELDRILDKVAKSGYNSLSAEEKRLLFDESKK